MTLNEKPPGSTHGSLRKMAKAVGLSHSSVQRIWAAHELKPHLTRSFNPRIKSGGSNDPKFCEKVQDIVGLYLDPPDRALVPFFNGSPGWVRLTKRARSRRSPEGDKC
jgi:hypothetical protein